VAVHGKDMIKAILLIITSSWTRNPQEELFFHQKLSANGRGIHRRNCFSTRNYQLMDEESTGGIVFPPGVIC
jgi:hypothetical protein